MNQILEHFSGKRVLVTGHTGFKGSWLSYILKESGASIYGLSLSEPKELSHSYHALGVNKFVENGSNALGDIRDEELLREILTSTKPDFIFHLAAQALVLESYRSPFETMSTNILGTLNVLELTRTICPTTTLVLVTSDKCYWNDGRVSAYHEGDRLGGSDPYSASKAAAEVIAKSYMDSYGGEFLGGIATVRAGNVFGGGDWSENRLVPDAVRHFRESKVLSLRMPSATRPWTWVVDILFGYISVARSISIDPELSNQSWNFASGETLTVLQIAQALTGAFGLDETYISQGEATSKEAELLQIDPSKAKELLGWTVVSSVEDALARTASWYKAQSDGQDMAVYSRVQVMDLLRNQ